MTSHSPIVEYRFGDYHVRTDDLSLRFRGTQLPLAPKVVLTLIALLDSPGQVITKDELMRLVWGNNIVEEANLTQNIYSLRRQFQATSGQSIIRTLPRRGYALMIAVHKNAVASRPDTGPARSPKAWLAGAAASLIAGLALIVSGYAVRTPELSSDAQRSYDLGWYYWRGVTPTGVLSIDQFENVVRSEPASSLGYAAEAVAYAKLSDLESSAASVADADTAHRLAAEAIAMDDGSAMSHAARGFVEWDLESDNVGAASDLSDAVAIDPSNGFARMWYGDLLLWRGDITRARVQLEAAANIDPTLPGLDYALGLDYYLSRDYADSAAFAKVALDDAWSSDAARLLLAAAYDEGRRYDEAIDVLKPMPSSISSKIAVYGTLAHVYASMGEFDRAHAALDIVERLSTQYEGRPVLTALAYASNGRREEAFAWLSRLPHSDRQVFALDPRFDSLHRDPRFVHWLHG